MVTAEWDSRDGLGRLRAAGGNGRRELQLTPFRITLLYLAVGLAGLYLSDVVLVSLLSDPFLSRVQALKGAVEVVLTGGLIFGLTHRRERQLQAVVDTLGRHRDELHMLHRVVRHNLRNDLNIIIGFLGLLESELTSDLARTRVRKLEATLDRMERYTEQLRRIKEVSDTESESVTVDLSETISRLVASNPDVTDDVEVTTSIPPHVEVACNPMVREACSELLTNAIKHNTADRPTIRIEVEPGDPHEEMVAIRFRDNGPGLPESELRALRTGGEPPLLHSTGLGLWFVDWMIAHSGGELTARRIDSEGTEITLYLPKNDRHRTGGLLNRLPVAW